MPLRDLFPTESLEAAAYGKLGHISENEWFGSIASVCWILRDNGNSAIPPRRRRVPRRKLRLKFESQSRPRICLLNLNPIECLIKAFCINCWGKRKVQSKGHHLHHLHKRVPALFNLLQLKQNAQGIPGTPGSKSIISANVQELFYSNASERSYRMA